MIKKAVIIKLSLSILLLSCSVNNNTSYDFTNLTGSKSVNFEEGDWLISNAVYHDLYLRTLEKYSFDSFLGQRLSVLTDLKNDSDKLIYPFSVPNTPRIKDLEMIRSRTSKDYLIVIYMLDVFD